MKEKTVIAIAHWLNVNPIIKNQLELGI